MRSGSSLKRATPYTPADCNLQDFGFMPIDGRRLLTSETWILATGEERAAIMALILESWHQVPAGSLPDNDRMLAHLSQSKCWTQVREHVMRGWVLCVDGRYYHKVVAEKVLVAWIEKLLNSRKGAVGNSERWRVEVDLQSLDAKIADAVQRLKQFAPQSKTLRKKAVTVIVQRQAARAARAEPQASPGDDERPDEADTGPHDVMAEFELSTDEEDEPAAEPRRSLCDPCAIPQGSEPSPNAPPNDPCAIAVRSPCDRNRQGEGEGEVNKNSGSSITTVGCARARESPPPDDFAQLLRGYGIACDVDDARLVRWRELEATPADVMSAVAEAGKRRSKAQSRQPVNVGLVDAILPDVIAARRTQAGGSAGPSSGEWWRSWSGMVAFGQSNGVVQREGEPDYALRLRIYQAAGDGPWWNSIRQPDRFAGHVPVAAALEASGLGRRVAA